MPLGTGECMISGQWHPPNSQLRLILPVHACLIFPDYARIKNHQPSHIHSVLTSFAWPMSEGYFCQYTLCPHSADEIHPHISKNLLFSEYISHRYNSAAAIVPECSLHPHLHLVLLISRQHLFRDVVISSFSVLNDDFFMVPLLSLTYVWPAKLLPAPISTLLK